MKKVFKLDAVIFVDERMTIIKFRDAFRSSFGTLNESINFHFRNKAITPSKALFTSDKFAPLSYHGTLSDIEHSVYIFCIALSQQRV